MEHVYDDMWLSAEQAFRQDDLQLDPYLASPHKMKSDTRRGITLLARPQLDFGPLLQELNTYFTEQYIYPSSDVHITLLSIESCSENYKCSPNLMEEYAQALMPIIERMPAFDVSFKGLCATNSCILLKGYALDDRVSQLRAEIREFFRHSSLPNSIDARYVLETLHTTLLRFSSEMNNLDAAWSYLQENRHKPFASVRVKSVELVFNDWYQTSHNTQCIKRFELD